MMKRNYLRLLAFLTALAMVLCCFAGCKGSGNDEEAVLDEEISGTNTVTDQDVENDAPAVVDDEDTTVVGPDESEEPSDDEDDEPSDDEPSDDDSADDENDNPADDGKEDNENQEDNSDDNEDLFADEEKDYSDHFIVASYNVQSFQGSKEEEYDGIAKEIKELGAVVVGLQELQYLTPGNDDQVKVIAEKAGFEYYAFTKAIDHKGGEYGTGVISKYPIKDHTVIKFETQYAEERSFSRSVIDMGGGKIMNFYNTHLCLGSNGEQAKQVGEIIQEIKKRGDKNVVITGDLNTKPDALIPIFDSAEFIPLNGGDTFLAFRNTFPAGNSPSTPIDNIIVSTDWDYYMEEDTTIGILVSYTEWSDHNMCYTYLKFKD